VGTGAAVAISLALDPGEGTEKTGIVLGSAVGGAILGTLVGHYLFDPEKDSAKVASVPPPPPIADPDAVAHGGSDANVR
jgi:hypothetical protein